MEQLLQAGFPALGGSHQQQLGHPDTCLRLPCLVPQIGFGDPATFPIPRASDPGLVYTRELNRFNCFQQGRKKLPGYVYTGNPPPHPSTSPSPATRRILKIFCKPAPCAPPGVANQWPLQAGLPHIQLQPQASSGPTRDDYDREMKQAKEKVKKRHTPTPPRPRNFCLSQAVAAPAPGPLRCSLGGCTPHPLSFAPGRADAACSLEYEGSSESSSSTEPEPRGTELFCLEYEADSGEVTAVIVRQVCALTPGRAGKRTGQQGGVSPGRGEWEPVGGAFPLGQRAGQGLSRGHWAAGGWAARGLRSAEGLSCGRLSRGQSPSILLVSPVLLPCSDSWGGEQ
nr:UPF0561 protein C2orf68 homolog [Pelodiscus sinensis]|eukprot:XP_025044305.1 UPF0561 protein C2orf68 homolog [Pelodiscus sinensis]